MTRCPVCNAEITDDFGLVECRNCGAQLIVHVDGQVEAAEPINPDAVAENTLSQPDPPPIYVQQPEGESGFDLESGQEPMPDPGADAPGEFSEAFATPADGTFESHAGQAPAEGHEHVADELAEIARFGNSDASSGRDGSLRYNVTISGIDTSDVREAFREAITDRHLMWDTDMILRSLRDGQVRLHDVTPVKAFMLITRLRGLPVDVNWEQYAIQQG